jgi:hypothetical protein
VGFDEPTSVLDAERINSVRYHKLQPATEGIRRCRIYLHIGVGFQAAKKLRNTVA